MIISPSIKTYNRAKILRILKKKGIAPEIPEDLYFHRLVRYYKVTKQIPVNWKYDY